MAESKKPIIGIVMGSDSDWPIMKLAAEILDQFNIEYESKIVSAHRTPDNMYDYAENAKNTFLDRFQKGAKPKDIETFSISLDDGDIAIGNLLKESGLVQSTSEAMRLVKQGAVKINDEKIDDPKLSIEKNQELLVQVGKRRFLKIKT